MQRLKLALLLAFCVLPDQSPAWKADTIELLARTLGDELWKLNRVFTKSDQIMMDYKQMHASVKRKDGKQILESSLRSVNTMLKRKINAVKCMHAAAERLAKEFDSTTINDKKDSFEYCSAKYSQFYFYDGDTKHVIQKEYPVKRDHDIIHFMSKVEIKEDPRFYNIGINTNMSCVHVPTNIFYKEKDVLNAILWSKGLNEIFIKNYQADPSLRWQYFGSSHGILRFYPSMLWNLSAVDTYDCRVTPWYIEAATRSKDVIILFDVSGSMTGFRNYVARRTLRSLLDTLTNNDYVNVYTFKNQTKEVVSCFVGLVQATPENLQAISNILEPTDNGKKHKVPLEGYANLTTAYIKAFTTLQESRMYGNRNRTQGCNQLVMVITDDIQENLEDVFEEYNREVVNGKTHVPVRVFIYLIGKEVANVREIQRMACLNRGNLVHIRSVEEVQQQVLKYINVIARPIILEGEDPRPTWTHANVDYTPDRDKLMTSVTIPAFDYTNGDAMLLGVAGTDVPIDSIAKLAQPHKLGVNGYAFIVSNNGYLLLHPQLITTINGRLQENYNSVDFVEVEQMDDGKGPREFGDEIKMLRESLVKGVDGNKTQVDVLFHYDNMRRIARVKHDYFYNNLEGTPFSMGISLPTEYGNTELILLDNLLKGNITEYFDFNYRVHPDWTYCRYHYLEGHKTENAEMELLQFLTKNITGQQYVEGIQGSKFSVETHCGNSSTTLSKDDYYCNENLVKQLIFDANLTKFYIKSNLTGLTPDLELYNVSVRFIATSSGLTRWYYKDTNKNEIVDGHGSRTKTYKGKVFGDYFFTATEETWYKAAVLQHMINKKSIVISTPLPILDETIKSPSPVENEDGDIIITASYAIFHENNDSETPLSVVGFRFSYLNFYNRLKQISNHISGERENYSCDEDNYRCYIVDSSGYVVLSREQSEVGKFFGIINPYVLQSFLEKNIFKYVEVFNYQALCSYSTLEESNSACLFETPFSVVRIFFRWLLVELIFILSDAYNNWHGFVYATSVEDYTDVPTNAIPPLAEHDTKIPDKGKDDTLFSCDHRINLYILNQTTGVSPIIYEDKAGECHPPYWASYIKRTNLLLIVIEEGDWKYSEKCKKPLDTKPRPTSNSTTRHEPCHKLGLSRLPRRREHCFTYYKERNITACNIGSVTRVDALLFAMTAVAASLIAKTFSV